MNTNKKNLIFENTAKICIEIVEIIHDHAYHTLNNWPVYTPLPPPPLFPDGEYKRSIRKINL